MEKFLAIVSAGALRSLVTIATPEPRGTLSTMGRAQRTIAHSAERSEACRALPPIAPGFPEPLQ